MSKSKNGVSSIESVIFYYGIVMGVYRGVEWNEKWVNPLIGLRGINSKNGVSAIESVIFYYGIVMGEYRGAEWT